MMTNMDNLVSITEANQNFSKVVKKLNEDNKFIILKNNKPQYIVSKYSKDHTLNETEIITVIAKMILTEHSRAFRELAL